MPNRDHRPIGAAVGGAAAFVCARNEPPPELFAEVMGGALFGYVGGAMPDWLEPATSPRHRGTFHSVATLVGIAMTGRGVQKAQLFCRARAQALRDEAQSLDGWAWLVAQVKAVLWGIAAGACSGFRTGYASHLLLDAQTPAGLPML